MISRKTRLEVLRLPTLFLCAIQEKGERKVTLYDGKNACRHWFRSLKMQR